MSIHYPDNTSSRLAISASGLSDSTTFFDVVSGGSERRLSLAELKKTGVQVANASQYGAIGDGVTDDTVALQDLFDSYSQGVRHFVLEPDKTYLVSSRLFLTAKDDWTLDLHGSSIKCSASSPVSADGQILHVRQCNRWTIENGTLDGNRDNRAAAAQVPAHNLAIYDCEDFVVSRVVSKNARVDGFYLDETTQGDPTTSSYRGEFVNCIADNCTRQGMSIISGHHISVTNSSFMNTNGLTPGAGIDIEGDVPNSDPTVTHIKIHGCTFSGNFGNGVQISATSDARDIVVSKCYFNGYLNVDEDFASEKAVACTVADTLDSTSHGLPNGSLVVFSSTWNLPTGLSSLINYYVINATANTFQVSLSSGGSAVSITAGSGSGSHVVRKFNGTERVISCSSANTLDSTSHGFTDLRAVIFRTSSALPTGLTAGSVIYYVINATANTFQVSLSPGGSPVAITAGSGSGVSYAAAFGDTLRCDAPAVLDGNVFRGVVSWRGVVDCGNATDGRIIATKNKFIACSPRYANTSCFYFHSGCAGKSIVSANFAEWCPWFAYVDADDVIVANNIVQSSTRDYGGLAVVGTAAMSTQVTGNTVRGANKNAVLVLSSASNVNGSITGNVIADTLSVAPNASYGTIRVLTDGYIVSKNTIYLSTPVTNAVAIEMSSSGSSVDGNICVGYSPTTAINVAAGKATACAASNVPSVQVTASSGDATPSVRGGVTLTTANSSATTITALDDGVAGQTVIVLFNDANTTVDFTGTTLKGNGGVDWTPASGDHMACTFNGTNWYCIVSDN